MPKKVPLPKIRAKGKGFEARPYIDGKQVSVYRATMEEVRDELIRLLRQPSGSSSTITLADYLKQWLEREESRVRTGRRAYSTYVGRKLNLEKYVIPGLGHIQLNLLDRATVKAYFERLERQAHTAKITRREGQRGTRVLQIAFETARAALNEAMVDDNLITENPFASPPGSKRSIKPHHEEQAKDFLTWEQWEVGLGEAQSGDYPDYTYPLLLTALTTGMRQGELLGLQKSKIDLANRIIHVDTQAADSFDGLTLKRPKMSKVRTKKRDITIPEETAVVLAAYMAHHPSDLVFPNSEGGIVHRGNFMNRVFRPILTAAGLPTVDFHSMRHTHASMLISAGVNIKTLSVRLGHEDIKTTLNIYGHLLPNDDAKAAQVFDVHLSKKRGLRAITSVG